MNEDRIVGTAKDFAGKAENAFVSGRRIRQSQASGRAREMAGKAQDIYGQAEDAVQDAADKATDYARECTTIAARPSATAHSAGE